MDSHSVRAPRNSSIEFQGILPLALAREIKRGLEEFLHTSFRPSTRCFKNLITDFTSDPDNLFRGPYLGIDLPFTTADTDTEFFPAVPLGHTPYTHQQRAFARLQGNVRASTLVATGTGSGKTECFLLPILDWCLQQSGQPGIKAIVIYPMNALAEDQAKRLAAQIWENPHLKGKVRAGMYADQEPKNAARTMRPDDVIRSRRVMHENPPDILLTNYKMLDQLLLRPNRKQLWEQNSPDTFRYLVVDELHTFDGAQGTDLAYLIRRLKTRLKTPPQSLCCVGTSATLGTNNEAGPIIQYAEKLFGEEFSGDALVTEDRIEMAQLMEQVQQTTLQDHVPSPDTVRQLAQGAHAQEPLNRIRLLCAAWFEDLPTETDDVSQDAWRAQLGTHIGNHSFLFHLLTALDGQIQSLDAVAEHLQRALLPAWRLTDILDLLDGFVALFGFAKRQATEQEYLPFLTVRIHFWIREMTRMVASIPSICNPGEMGPEDSLARLLHSQDLSSDHSETVLPIVNCRECGGMAWIAMESLQGDGFEKELDNIYRAYFSSQPSRRLTYLLPEQPARCIVQNVQHVLGHVCRRCLRWSLDKHPPEHCVACGSQDWCQVWRSQPQWVDTGSRLSGNRFQQSAPCAYCGSATGTGIFGVSDSSISSALVSLLFASKANGDPKLLAFGDSVQDVAHKAGFIEARSFRTHLRQAIAHWLSDQDDHVSYQHLHSHMAPDTRSQYTDDSEFVGALTHVDLMWLQTIDALLEPELDDKLQPAPEIDEQDLRVVERRVAWETFSELTFRSQFGRTLENIGCLTLSLDSEAIERAAQKLLAEASENLGTLFEQTSKLQLAQFLLGVLHRMLHDGAVRIERDDKDPIGVLAHSKGNWVAVTKGGKDSAYPRYGSQARKPLLPSLQTVEGLAALTDAGSSTRWYPIWVRKCLTGGEALRGDRLMDFYVLAFKCLTQLGLTERVDAERHAAVWVIPEEQVAVSLDSEMLECVRCNRRIHVHPGIVSLWTGMTCLNPSCHGGTLELTADMEAAPVLKDQLLHGPTRRVNARDHSGMLESEPRHRIERQFIDGGHTWYPNVLSTTPTLELGVDIGDLSSILLYAVPPNQSNYAQRLGRAGRREGTALGLTVVNNQSHDLFFWAKPPEMIQGAVTTPGLFLEATAILRRQFCAFTLERLIVDTGLERRFGNVESSLRTIRSNDTDSFPLNWIGFVAQHGESLLAGFQQMFELQQAKLNQHLQGYIRTSGNQESFAYSVLDCLQQAQDDDTKWREQISQLNKGIQTLRNLKPPPKDQEEQIGFLERDRSAFWSVVRNEQRQDVLELLTDFGILPNYAFPGEGIKLRSVVSHGGGSSWNAKTYKYTRAASTGLTELAPGAHFYAEGHRVPINEVDLKLSKPEKWRFCPVCPHMELDSDVVTKACPRCKSPKWQDIGQVHTMVRLKQLNTYNLARDCRIGDDQEQRTIHRYARDLYPSFDPQEAHTAHLLEALQPQPFGFEFLPHVEFHDVNFGHWIEERGMEVAGQGVQAEGFLLCEKCGHTLSNLPTVEHLTRYEATPRRQPAWKEEHARHCPVLNQANDGDARIETFLYHSFRSEAVRIRLPIRNADKSQIESFTAALNLGMQLKFKGQVDHLRSFTLSQGGDRGIAHWLFLYDSVPGGTGYLEQLVKPETFQEVLNLALQTMRECSCNQDQEQDAEQRKDGCYQCLYGYRHRRHMEVISRDKAIHMIQEILAQWSVLQTIRKHPERESGYVGGK